MHLLKSYSEYPPPRPPGDIPVTMANNKSAVAKYSGPVPSVMDGDDNKPVLTEEAGYEHLGFAWPTTRKWLILTSIFIVQISMNFNAAVYANSVAGMTKEFGINAATARLGQMVFLVAYAFGCELWAPWSEELGRKWVCH